MNETSPVLDDVLLGVVVNIELTNNDRDIVNRRYVKLSDYLTREDSKIAPYLERDPSRIYAQGSVAIGAVVVNGEGWEQFDLDAIVELNVPEGWASNKVLDLLEESLQGFPYVREIVRCTRCVQLRFANMHIDVTPMDPHVPQPVLRAGHIFHSPDSGQGARIDANPWGFVNWFRGKVVASRASFSDAVAERRRGVTVLDRIATSELLAELEQEALPQAIPPRLDSEQTLALKLIKRFLNLHYEKLPQKRPPSVFISKQAAEVGNTQLGLTEQLLRLAHYSKSFVDRCIAQNMYPDERNPSYQPDRLNDRWPTRDGAAQHSEDMIAYSKACARLVGELEKAKSSNVPEIATIIRDLFGEDIGTRVIEALIGSYDRAAGFSGTAFQRGAGTVLAAPALLSSRSVAAAPAQTFHQGTQLPPECLAPGER